MGCVHALPHITVIYEHGRIVVQVFFVNDKTMPGWSVVVKKESRGRRIKPNEDDYGLGLEPSTDDLQVLTDMDSTTGGGGRGIEIAGERQGSRRRQRSSDAP